MLFKTIERSIFIIKYLCWFFEPLKQTAIRNNDLSNNCAMKRKMLALIVVVLLLVVTAATGILWFELKGNKLYTYPFSVGQKTYTVSVLTNWDSAPKVTLSQSNLKFVSLDFVGSFRETVFYKITIPSDLLWGNISLVWKYYEQNPDRYILTNDGVYNSVQMTFLHTATTEHFEIHGTEGAW